MSQGILFRPSEEQRRTARAMAGFGIPQDDIAILLDIDPKTLRRHFRRNLDRGAIEATVKVAQTLFQMATVDKNVAAAIFWMKARAGWREKHEVKVSATPVETLRHLTDDQLVRILAQLDSIEGDEQEDTEPTTPNPLLLSGLDGGE
jgi:hypothetical protein